ncbi:RNAse H domain protein, YqgF family [Fannyhessea vaginae PB189-T1-4]|jgi:hypothetical protein|uniref:Putative pre-16S rRNA nuclease n=1 Tax=Fannyhessea vaginae PB189-T1-4 TaxID=866774 RepID=A0ABN0B0Q8_9ACTN|nr:Holliday junction resolvase RuvX [Fannyhessea vaginae]EFL44349.1 RNAse H domain protein, YqgF family [Fannyhessea vaginae PB189-T1-4]
MRVVALDIGDVRVGIAVSDATGSVASPVKVLPFQEVYACAKTFRRILEDYEPELLVCGLPKSLDGACGAQAEKITQQAQHIAACCNLPLAFVDERLSSSEAKRILRAQGYKEKQMRGHIDMIAASLFLQAYLDAQKG